MFRGSDVVVACAFQSQSFYAPQFAVTMSTSVTSITSFTLVTFKSIHSTLFAEEYRF